MKRITGKERLLKIAHAGVDRKKFPTGGKAGEPGRPKMPSSRPTAQDSLALYNNALAVLDYYNKRGYTKQERTFGRTVGGPTVIEEIEADAKTYDPSKKRWVPTKGGGPDAKGQVEIALPKSQFRRDLNENQFLQREGANNILDTRAPMQMYDRRITPTKKYAMENVNTNDPMYGDAVSLFTYDPNEIMPSFMRPKGKVPSSKFKRPVPKPAPKPAPELNPTKIRGIVQNEKPNVQANVQPRTVSNKSKFSATYRDPSQPDKQREIYFPTKKAWSDFMGTGALRATDTSENAADTEAHATGYRTGLYAEGGEVSMDGVEGMAGAEGGGGSGYAMAGQLLPQVGNLLQTLLDKPSYTNQPIMNAQTARNMTRPVGYAYGGELDDIDDEQYNHWLKGMFQNQASAEGEEEEGFDEGEEGDDEGRFGFEDQDEEGDEYADTEDEDEVHGEKGDENAYAMGGKAKKKGIYIKPSKRGTFTAAANKHGKSVQSFAAQVMANKENYSPAMVKKANFARNAAKWKKAMGGGAAQVDQPVMYAHGGWIKGAINPEHKGYCTPMTKSTCTPRRKALAKRFKKGGDLHKKAFGGFSAADMDGRREVGIYAFGSQADIERGNNLLANTPNPTVYAHGGMNNAGGNASELQLLLYANGGVFADEAQREVELQRGVYATGGKAKKNWIQGAVNPAHKGYCTPMTKSTCTPRRKALAKTFKKHHGFHAMGGDAQIEVEGNEILEAPNGEMIQPQGPTHEQGGIPMSVPEGTKIYSDRLGIEGKTMQQRKKSRERALSRIEKMMDRRPADVFLKNSYLRTKDVLDKEDAQDVQLMKVANDIYSPPERQWRQEGGKQEPQVTAAYGDVAGDPWSDYINNMVGGQQQNVQVPFAPGQEGNGRDLTPRNLNVSTVPSPAMNTPVTVTAQTGENFRPSARQMASAQAAVKDNDIDYGNAAGFTAGDYIGMGGNLFNAIAPIINTRNAARATKPERNRFKGFGREALEANQQAQTYAGKQQAYARRNVDTAYNSAANRNRSGARDINTLRALDTVADINRNKAIGDIDMSYSNQMAQLLGQQGQLANQRDQVVMSGEQARDEREAQNTDNYYSNMAENLTNFGNNIQGLGRNLNTSQGNRDNTALLEQMSEYFDFGRNKKGKLVLRNKRKKS